MLYYTVCDHGIGFSTRHGALHVLLNVCIKVFVYITYTGIATPSLSTCCHFLQYDGDPTGSHCSIHSKVTDSFSRSLQSYRYRKYQLIRCVQLNQITKQSTLQYTSDFIAHPIYRKTVLKQHLQLSQKTGHHRHCSILSRHAHLLTALADPFRNTQRHT